MKMISIIYEITCTPVLAVLLLASSLTAQAQDALPQSGSTSSASSVTAQMQDPPQPSGPLNAPSRFIVGWEIGNFFSFPYAILKVPLWGNLDNGVTLKLGGDGLQYEFDSSLGRIHATGPAAEALVGYAVTGQTGSFSLLVGPQYRHTDYDHGLTSSFPDWGFKADFSGTAHVNEMIHMSMSAFYATVNQMFRVQIRPVLIGHTKGIQIGPEAIFFGNPDINRYYGGLAVTGLSPTRWLSLTVHAGYMNSQSAARGDVCPLSVTRRLTIPPMLWPTRTSRNRMPNSIDTLAPNNRFVLEINKFPITPGIPFHTIEGDRGRGDAPNSSDGVVPYWSSHMTGAKSELIVPSNHSAPSNAKA